MSFSRDIDKYKNKTLKELDNVFRGSVLEIFGRVVKRTPVGNPDLWKSIAPPGYVGGRLRGNWQLGINSQNKSSGSVDASGGATIASALSASLTLKGGDTAYITNNLPYAGAVEDGWSSQAPAGMVKVTVAEFDGIVKSQVTK